MKKFLLFAMVLSLLFFTGCSKNGEEDVLNKLDKKINDLKSYQVQGILDISNNDDTYHYDVVASYQEKDQYRVSLRNQANNHEQIILKNNDGVFVLTPSLNKSFKFQSEWPNNNSQVYLLQSIVNDIKNDTERTFVENADTYVFTTKVNYPNNKRLVKQQVTLDKDLNFKEVNVMDDADISQMRMTFTNVDLKPTFAQNYFNLDEVMRTCTTCNDTDQSQENPDSSTDTEEETSALDDIIFPLYLPTGTKLTSQDRIEKTNGERVILTFDGEKPFILVEETAEIPEELSVIPTYGEPYLLIDTYGALSDNSVSWTSGGIDYYLASDVMSQEELVEIARSVNAIPTLK